MIKFEVGDKVKYVGPMFKGMTGTILGVYDAWGVSAEVLTLPTVRAHRSIVVGERMRLTPGYLELLDSEVGFSDIKKGMKIRSTVKLSGGSVQVLEGVVWHRYKDIWVDSRQHQLLSRYVESGEQVSIEILEDVERFNAESRRIGDMVQYSIAGADYRAMKIDKVKWLSANIHGWDNYWDHEMDEVMSDADEWKMVGEESNGI